VKVVLATGASLALLAGCSSPTRTAPVDGGARDSAALVDAGGRDSSVPVDASADGPGGSDAPDGSDASPDGSEPQLAAPTFAPAPGDISTGSLLSIVPPAGFPANGELFYSTNGQSPVVNGTLYTHGIDFEDTGTTTLMAFARAPGFLDSPVATGVYTVLDCCIGPVEFNPTSETTDAPFLLQLSVTPASATICYTLDGTTPTCDQASAACTGGSRTYLAAQPIPIGPAVTGPGGHVTVTATTCEANAFPSPLSSQSYTLILAPLELASQSSVGTGLPGWDWGGTGQPWTTMSIPGDAGAPYGPFVAQQVGSLPCTGAASCSGPAFALADFVCWSKAGPATCVCASPLPLTPAGPYATLPASADVSPGDTLSVIACQASTPVNATGFYGPSVPITVTF
jgi:hypothetical protein